MELILLLLVQNLLELHVIKILDQVILLHGRIMEIMIKLRGQQKELQMNLMLIKFTSQMLEELEVEEDGQLIVLQKLVLDMLS